MLVLYAEIQGFYRKQQEGVVDLILVRELSLTTKKSLRPFKTIECKVFTLSVTSLFLI